MAVYALSDLHGNLELLKAIQKFLNENDTVYFLGRYPIETMPIFMQKSSVLLFSLKE